MLKNYPPFQIARWGLPAAAFATLATLAAIDLSGCKKEEGIIVYRVSKAAPETTASGSAAPEAPEASAMPSMSAPGDQSAQAVAPATADQPAQVTGSAPADWLPQPLSAMRQASYVVKGDNGASADISLVILDGPAGGTLDNVNRWLSQLGQAGMDQDKLSKTAQHVAAPLGDVTLVDLEGLPSGGDATKDGRIVGGIVTTADRTVFFKMHGNAALTESQKVPFIQWVASVRLDPSAAAAAAPAAAQSAAIPPAIAPSGNNAQIQWQVPDGWKSAPATSMRYATFNTSGQTGAAADVSVVMLDGEGGGDLQNVNRWRGQLGLDPVTDEDLKSLVVPVKAKDGGLLTVDMSGPTSRLLAGWTRVDGKSWFFKLTGPESAAGAEKEKFIKFLESIQFHP
ncbi:MAG TPA: hypothetical protein VHY22_09120 [Chthoniobacteraceae bacterium]|nr:hypothetical protein [Chthoniobacteraceae bacterium]